MKKEIVVNRSHEETRVAVLENSILTDLFIERKESEKIVGNIYKGRVDAVLPGISSAFVNIGLGKNAYLNTNDVIGPAKHNKIEKVLKKNDEIMVQVDKEPISTKGAKVTMDISLPGRLVVFMPFADHNGISKNIEEHEERNRLKTILESVKPSCGGVIVRTEAEDATKDEIKREIKYLERLWNSINNNFKSSKPSSLLHKDLGVVFQTIRDYFNEDVDHMTIDSKTEFKEVQNFVKIVSPELIDRVTIYGGKTPIFKAYSIEEEIKKLRLNRVNLPSGGSLIIQEAESLCAIDVNTGRFVGKSTSQEETVTINNVEAAKEIARQLRIRNIGGIVVIDFIDMRKAKNRQKVLHAMSDAVKGDKAKIKILPITKMGLIEMTRERRRESLHSLLGENCPMCHGSGQVLSKDSLFIQVINELEQLKLNHYVGKVRVRLHPAIAPYFKERVERLKRTVGSSVEVQHGNDIEWEDYQIIVE